MARETRLERCKAGYSREASPWRRCSPLSLLLLLLMLGGLLAQSIATQAHFHTPISSAHSAVSIQSTGAAKHAVAELSAASIVADCPLCRELAMSGQYLLPAPTELVGKSLASFWLFAIPAALLLCRQRSHRWQSRAPPQ